MTEKITIYVDADACPVVQIVEEIAQKYDVPVTLLCDTNHVLSSDYSNVKIIDAGADAVDYALIRLCHAGDIVMLMERHLSKKERRGNSRHHLKGPKKRTAEDDVRFKESFEKMVKKALGSA